MKKPNIVLILIDDMGIRDLGCTGSSFYETPNIDRLAREGVQFTNAYASCPVCSPSRASIMSGKYPASVGVTDWIDLSGKYHPARGYLVDAPYIKHLPLTEKTVASSLKEHGYATWHVGKWHLGTEEYYPEHHGFDVNIGGCHMGHPYYGYFSPYQIENLTDGPEGEYLTDRLTDEAVKLIWQQPADEPFFLNLWHYTVHIPVQARAEDVLRFEEKAGRLGLDKMNPFVEGEFFPVELKKEERVTRRVLQSDPVYAAMIYNLDVNIGRLMDALEKTGRLHDTLVFFTSDNGGLSTSEGSPTCNLPSREGKGWMYEGGVRVPMIVWGPEYIKGGTVCEEPVTSPDFYPTFLEYAGASLLPEQHRDGKSFKYLLEGGAPDEERPLFWHYPHYGNQGGTPGSSVRLGKYKLIEFFEDESLELYDLEEDASELHNLALQLPEVTEKLHKLLVSWRVEIEAKIPQKNMCRD